MSFHIINYDNDSNSDQLLLIQMFKSKASCGNNMHLTSTNLVKDVVS